MKRPTSRAGNSLVRGRHGIGADGFTLLEMLIVFVILGMAFALVAISVARRSDRMTVSALAAEIASHARASRDTAIRTGRDTRLSIDLGRRIIASASPRSPLPIPADVEVEVVASFDEQNSNGVSGIRFFPNGASTGGTIRLGQAGSAYEVRINWFTGRVHVIVLG